MNKSTIYYIALILLAGGLIFFAVKQKRFNLNSVNDKTDHVQETYTVPERPADLRGEVLQVQGNEIILLVQESQTEDISEEEREIKRSQMQSLSPEERQALREERLASGEIKTYRKTVIIPVGTLLVKSTADNSGDLVKASYEDIKAGSKLSIWYDDNKNIEIVKIRGLNNE